ncbi:acyltransferase family domain-containing protein [Ditylenchus destructor]|nr:acyltransferase family domain-containing protein [Ditylenchus destructor]
MSSYYMLLFCILALTVKISLENVPDYNEVPLRFRLSEAELRGINEKGLDYEYSEDVGKFIGEFFHDSQAQLILDLDVFREIWKELDKLKESALDGDVDYVQTVVDFFKPLQHYDVSSPCLSDIMHFLWTTYNYAKTAKAASNCTDCQCTKTYKADFRQYQWIFDVVDAIGKIPSAVVSGNNLWTGSWYTCRKISAVKNQQGQLWKGQYCMARFQPYNRYNPLKAFVSVKSDPADVCRENQSIHFEEWSEEDRRCFDMLPLLNLGLCLPDTCTDYDTQKIIQFLYGAAEMILGRKLVCNVDVKCSNSKPESQIWNDNLSIAVLCFILCILGLMIFGTCYDKQKRHELVKNSIKQDEDNADKTSKVSSSINLQPHGFFVTFIMMFSIVRNIEYIMNTATEGGQIRCLHGARFFSMCWVIFGHTYYYICTSLTTDNLLQTLRDFPRYFYNQMVVQAPLAVDSFFFLSGLLTSYIFLGKLKKNQIQLTALSTWIAYFFRRYLRLTPVYIVIMVLSVTLFTYISEGPFWRPIDVNLCRNSWWTNLLYVNNFLMQDDACMGWTWYLANDFQLYSFAPIIIILLHKFKVGGVLFSVLLLVLSSAFKLYITLEKGYPPAPLLTSKLQIVAVLGDYWTDLYVKPYIRCGPYIVGCLVGHLLIEKKQSPFKLTKIQWIFGWAIASILGIYSVFGLYHYTKTGEISAWWAILYTVAGRPSFAFCLGWVTFACETNGGRTANAILGHKMFIPLSKLTFCAYLVHPILLQLYYLSRPNAFHFTHSFQLLHMFFVAVFMSYAVALVFSLAFEMPVMHIDRLLFTGRGGEGHSAKENSRGSRRTASAESQDAKQVPTSTLGDDSMVGRGSKNKSQKHVTGGLPLFGRHAKNRHEKERSSEKSKEREFGKSRPLITRHPAPEVQYHHHMESSNGADQSAT